MLQSSTKTVVSPPEIPTEIRPSEWAQRHVPGMKKQAGISPSRRHI